MSSSVSFPAVVHCLRTLSLVAVDFVRLVALAARVHCEFKIMRRLESDTTRDNVYATGRTRNRLVTPVR